MTFNKAGRGSRIAAGAIDIALGLSPFALAEALMVFVIKLFVFGPFLLIPFMIFSGFYGLALLGIQLRLLHKSGQTIGKRWMKIKIVKTDDGKNGGLTVNFVKRMLIPVVICIVPFVNLLFLLVDFIFMFRKDEFCLHDHIAKTVVVKA